MNLLASDVIWRNGRLATMSTQQKAPYGIIERHALIVRDKHIIAVIPEDQIPAKHPLQVDLQHRLVTPDLSTAIHTLFSVAIVPMNGNNV